MLMNQRKKVFLGVLCNGIIDMFVWTSKCQITSDFLPEVEMYCYKIILTYSYTNIPGFKALSIQDAWKLG